MFGVGKLIELVVPASSANLGAGYDVFGLALDGPRDKMVFERATETELEVGGEFGDCVPGSVLENSAGVVVERVLDDFGISEGVEVVIDKEIPPSSGLGSSAASSAGAAVGVDKLFDLGLGKQELLEYSAFGEEVAAGTKHYDNIAPLIYGGLTAYSDGEILSLEEPKFDLVIALPEETVNTGEARKDVPKSVSIEDVKRNVFYASSLIAGAIKNDIKLFGKGLRDEVVEPIRAEKQRGYKVIEEAASGSGALGLTLSGSGPATIIATKKPKEIEEAIRNSFEEEKIGCRVFITQPSSGIELIQK